MNAETIWEDIGTIRSDGPLVHNITNFVAMDVTANALLALGASPVMAHAIEEVEDMVGIASSLVLNIGTLSGPWIEAMFKAAAAAKRRGLRVVFDPVGAGATPYRTETSRRILDEIQPAILRGNPSEIMALVSSRALTKGVDTKYTSEKAVDAAFEIADKYHCVVSVSGAVDLIVSGNKIIKTANGHPLMAKVTGLGCTATALTGAFATVNPSPFEAAATAMAVMGIAGEMASEKAQGPGSFRTYFIDAL
ncbi:MAG: hydroxyethylthiazole kinase, partial [Candidatus Aminicenantales bacterium]